MGFPNGDCSFAVVRLVRAKWRDRWHFVGHAGPDSGLAGCIVLALVTKWLTHNSSDHVGGNFFLYIWPLHRNLLRTVCKHD